MMLKSANRFTTNLLNHLLSEYDLFTLHNYSVFCSLGCLKSKFEPKVVFQIQSFLVLTVLTFITNALYSKD